MGLLRCVPHFGMNNPGSALQTIPGTLPALGEPLTGCIYAARCPMAKPVCTRREPDLFCGRATRRRGPCRGEAAEPDPGRLSPHHAAPVGEGGRHARCYFATPWPGCRSHCLSWPPPWRPTWPPTSLRSRHCAHLQGREKEADRGQRRVPQAAAARRSAWWANRAAARPRSPSASPASSPPTPASSPSNSAKLRPTRPPSQETLRAIRMVFQNPDSTFNPAWSTRAILRRAVRKLGGARGGSVRAKWTRCPRACAWSRASSAAAHWSFRADRSSASASPAPSPAIPTLVSATNPLRRWTSQSRRASSTCSSRCRPRAWSLTCSSVRPRGRALHLGPYRLMYLAELIEVGAAERGLQPAHHPYTEALLSSIPKLDFDAERSASRCGAPCPSLSEPPSGCRFLRAAIASSATSACSRSRRCSKPPTATPTAAISRRTSAWRRSSRNSPRRSTPRLRRAARGDRSDRSRDALGARAAAFGRYCTRRAPPPYLTASPSTTASALVPYSRHARHCW